MSHNRGGPGTNQNQYDQPGGRGYQGGYQQGGRGSQQDYQGGGGGGGYNSGGPGGGYQQQQVGGYQQEGGGYQQQGAEGSYGKIAEGNHVEKMDSATPHRTLNLFGRVVDYDLSVSKLFYFFFYGAFGSLFPLIAIYFKQLGMNATQAGFLIGIRPFIEFASSPFWGHFADRFRKGKILLLFSLLCWIAFTVALNYIQPGNPYCIALQKEGAKLTPIEDANTVNYDNEKGFIHLAYVKPGLAPVLLTANNTIGYNQEKGTLIRPPYSTRVYKKSQVEEAFLLLLLVIILGEFFSAPACNLADACTMSLLEDTPELYGRQRIFGSLGWGLAMFFVGIALDYSVFPNHPCGNLEFTEKNYSVCFGVFAVLMICAFLAASQFSFSHEIDSERPDNVPRKLMDAQTRNVAPEVAQSAKALQPDFVETSSTGPLWLSFLKTCSSAHHIAFLFVTWWMGFGVGLVFSFLFWHLQDLGGSPTLFGLASVINHISEVASYFFAFKLINKYGHIKVLYLGLVCNSFRFFYVSILYNPFWVLPFEFIQGITHATVWAAASSYISLIAPEQQKSTAQGVLQALHHGIGKGCGAIIGGIIITYEGTTAMFVAYGIICLLVCAGFYAVNRIFKVEERTFVGEAALQGDTHALAPHGIPLNVPYDKKTTNYENAPYQNVEPVPDPKQDAYDRYIHEPYNRKPNFEPLPGAGRR